MNSCTNCSSENQAHSKFCHNCGQKLTEELNMKILFSATIANYFSVDSSLKKSIVPLLFKPGQIAKEFVNGKRTTFIHPAKFYLFTSFLFFILIGFVSKEDSNMPFSVNTQESILDSLALDSGKLEQLTREDSSILIHEKNAESYSLNFNSDSDSLSQESGFLSSRLIKGIKKMENNELNIIDAFLSRLPMAIIFSVPIFALFLLLILYKRKKPYSAHLVFSLYYFTFSFIIWSIYFSADAIFSIDFGYFIGTLLIGGIWAYLCAAVKQFYNLSWKKSIGISLLQSIFYLGIILPVMAILIVIIALAFA